MSSDWILHPGTWSAVLGTLSALDCEILVPLISHPQQIQPFFLILSTFLTSYINTLTKIHMLWAIGSHCTFHLTIKIHQHNRLREFVNRLNENQIQKQISMQTGFDCCFSCNAIIQTSLGVAMFKKHF